MLKNNAYLIILIIYGLVIIVEVIRSIINYKNTSDPEKLVAGFLRTNYVLLGIAVIACFINVVFTINFLNYSFPIPYGKYEGITLSDFKGFTVPGKTLNGSNQFATIKTSIEYDLDSKGLTAISYFHPSRSYVFNRDNKSKNLLTHEIYHFKISEYWCRVFKQRVSQLNAPTNNAVSDIYIDILNQENYMQKKYDRETAHSYVLSKQREWETRLDSLLDNLGDFKNSRIKFD